MKNKINLFFKKVVMNNIGYKLLSMVVAVMIWLIIINIADPVTTRRFTGLNVNIINESAITSVNQVYEVVSGDTVDFTVRGKASVIKNLKLSDFSATADLAKLSPVYAADIVVTCQKSEENIEVDSGNSVLIVKLEELDTKNVRVTVETTGEVEKGHYVDDYEVKPNMLTVTGGVSKIAKLDSVKVLVSVAGAKKTFSTDVAPIPYDKDGNKLDPEGYTFMNSGNEIKEVKVNMTIYRTKSIPITVSIQGEPASGYRYSGTYEYTPENIVIGGSRKALEKVDKLEVPVDITGASESFEKDIDITKILSDSVKPVGTEQIVSVRVTCEKLESKAVEFSASDISINGLSDEYEVELLDPGKKYSVFISGTEEQLALYSAENMGAHVDIEDNSVGEYHLKVQFSEQFSKLLSSDAAPIVLGLKITEKKAESTPEPTKKTESEDDSGTTAPETFTPVPTHTFSTPETDTQGT